MTYNIQFLETNAGTATQVEVQTQDRFTTADKAIIYYDLRNIESTTQADSIPSGNFITLPYAILFRSKIVVTGATVEGLMAGTILPIDILLTERPDIRLRKRTVLLLNDCFGTEIGEFYLDNEDFSKTAFIYVDADLKQRIKYEGKISDNTNVGYYSPKSGLREINPCKGFK
jgi:hypothetical protein